ncbi:hypothetical protein ACWEN6_25215 [Sphaerisporangium sp. NPDC004334]
MSEYPSSYGTERASDPQARPSAPQRAKEAAGEVAGTAGHAVGEVAGTATEQVAAVAGEVRNQAGQAIGQLRGRAAQEVDSQTRKAVQGIRQWADDLSAMAENGKPESPVRTVTHHVADTGRRAADYLEEHGVAGVTDDVQRFARRRPGVFLAGAVAAGFLVGRLAKAGMKADEADRGQTGRDSWQGGDRDFDRSPAAAYGYEPPVRQQYTGSPYATTAESEYSTTEGDEYTATQYTTSPQPARSGAAASGQTPPQSDYGTSSGPTRYTERTGTTDATQTPSAGPGGERR